MLNNLKKRALALGATVSAGVVTLTGTASAAVALPDMPVDFTDYATAGMVVVGSVLGAIAGIVVVVKLTQMGLQKLGSAFSGRA